MEYPTAYRNGAAKYEVVHRGGTDQAFKDLLRRRSPNPLGPEPVRIPPGATPQEVFRTLPKNIPPFGKAAVSDRAVELLERELRHKLRKLPLRLVPIVGELALAYDVYDISGELIHLFNETGEGGTGFNPGPDGFDWSTWENLDNTNVSEDSDAWVPQGYYRVPGQWWVSHNRYTGYDPTFHGVGAYTNDAPGTTTEEVLSPLRMLEAKVIYKCLPFSYEYGDYAYWDERHIRTETSLSPDGTGWPDTGTTVKTQAFFDEAPTRMPELIPGYGKEVSEQVKDDTLLEQEKAPSEIKSVNTILTQSGSVSVSVGTHQLAPPPPKTKERKVVPTSAALGIVKAAMNQITEGDDAITAIWKTLPNSAKSGYFRIRYFDKKTNSMKEFWRAPRYKTKGGKTFYAQPNPAEKWRDVYKHWDKVNVHEAIENLAKNQIEDMLIGSAVSRTNKGLRSWYDQSGRPVGIFTGPAL